MKRLLRAHVLHLTFTLTLLFSATVVHAQGGGGNPPPPPPQAQALGSAPVPTENPITEAKRVLGKILFWDEQLSSDNTVACGTCHKPAAGGADTRLALNPGFDAIFGTDDDVIGSPGIRKLDSDGMQMNDPMFGHGPQVTGRATPSFLTAMFADSNFWDGRATDQFTDPLDPDSVIIGSGGALESQAVGPILSAVEMAQAGRTWQDVIDKLSAVTPLALASNIPADMQDALQGNVDYPQLFAAAFTSEDITPARIAMAIATYERTLVPNETPWDKYVAGDNNAMTPDQVEGWNLFDSQTPCGNCHRPPLFSDNNFRNIGLRPALEDLGEFIVSGQNNDRGDFKTPSLRNVGLRKALMHVGWITDAADAIDFYNAGTSNTGHTQFTQDQSGIPDTNLDIDEINVFADDPVQRGKIVEFLTNGLTDPRVAQEIYPFDRPLLGTEQQLPMATSNDNIGGVASNGNETTAIFSASIVSENGANSASYFSAQETLAVSARIDVDPADQGKSAELYCVIAYAGAYYAMQANGTYEVWNGDPATLPSVRSIATLGSIEHVAVAANLSQTPGTFDLYVAYQAASGALKYNSQAIRFVVE